MNLRIRTAILEILMEYDLYPQGLHLRKSLIAPMVEELREELRLARAEVTLSLEEEDRMQFRITLTAQQLSQLLILLDRDPSMRIVDLCIALRELRNEGIITEYSTQGKTKRDEEGGSQ